MSGNRSFLLGKLDKVRGNGIKFGKKRYGDYSLPSSS